MLIQANQRAVLRTRLVAVILPVPAPAPPTVHHIIIAVTHTIIQEAQAVQLDSKTILSTHLIYRFLLIHNFVS
jgi:hypothetical protein